MCRGTTATNSRNGGCSSPRPSLPRHRTARSCSPRPQPMAGGKTPAAFCCASCPPAWSTSSRSARSCWRVEVTATVTIVVPVAGYGDPARSLRCGRARPEIVAAVVAGGLDRVGLCRRAPPQRQGSVGDHRQCAPDRHRDRTPDGVKPEVPNFLGHVPRLTSGRIRGSASFKITVPLTQLRVTPRVHSVHSVHSVRALEPFPGQRGPEPPSRITRVAVFALCLWPRRRLPTVRSRPAGRHWPLTESSPPHPPRKTEQSELSQPHTSHQGREN